MWTGSHLLFQCKDPTDKAVCESWQPVSAMCLDQSTDMLLTLQQRSPKYFSTTRRKRKKKKVFANAQLLSSISLVVWSEDIQSSPKCIFLDRCTCPECIKEWMKNELHLLLLQHLNFNLELFTALDYPFPGQLWWSLWEQQEMPGMGIALWFIRSVWRNLSKDAGQK